MKDYKTMTVAEIVTDKIEAGDVFKKYDIDFCCGGDVQLSAVCEENNINIDEVVTEIEQSSATVFSAHDYNAWDLDFLADFVLNTHHKFVEKESPILLQYSEKVAQVHGASHPEVIRINQLTHALVDELLGHMQKEEMILFPNIKSIAKALKNGTTYQVPPFGSLQNPINVMEAEHDSAGDIIKEIKQLTNDFTPPEGACNTFIALYAKLEAYQNDLFQHIHIENNILFPKAVELEKELV